MPTDLPTQTVLEKVPQKFKYPSSSVLLPSMNAPSLREHPCIDILVSPLSRAPPGSTGSTRGNYFHSMIIPRKACHP